MLSQKSRLLSEMFPYDIENKKNGELRKGLKEYEFFLEALSEAGTHFQNGHLERFDSLVSENACQVRAIKIAIIASNNNIDFQSIIHQISCAKKILNSLLEERTIAKLMINNISLKNVIENENLDILLSYEQFFLYQSFLLCEMKELGSSKNFVPSLTSKDKTCHKKLKRFNPEVSASFTNCVVNKARKHLAETSINFVRKIAADLKDLSLIKMASNDFTLEHNALPCIPMFWTYKTLLKTAQNESVPLVIHAQFVKKQEIGYEIVDEDLLFFKPSFDHSGIKYTLTHSEEIDLAKPACVIQGVVCIGSAGESFDKIAWQNRMTNQSIIDIILAGAADHKQYPTESKDIPIYDLEYENYKSLAKRNGFSLDNPNTFFINHVFPMQIGRAHSLIKTA